MEVKYMEIERQGSRGMAVVRKRALEETYGEGSIMILKDVTDSPFTSFRTDAYVLLLKRGVKK